MVRPLLLLALGGFSQTLSVAATSISCAIQDAATAGQRVVVLCERDQLYVSQDRGANWEPRSLPPGVRFRAVEFLDPRRGFVVGDDGTLLATEDGGDAWRSVTVPTKQHLASVCFVGNQSWISGYNGVILHSDDAGRTWSAQASGVTQALEGIFFADATHGWAVGWIGTMIRTTDGGRTWQPARAPDMLWSLNSVYFSDLRNGWAVGFAGQILRSKDGGASWELQKSPVTTTLSSVLFDSSGHGWITAGNALLASHDGGENWQAIGIEDQLFLSRLLAVDKSIWAIGQSGILTQSGAGQNWQRLDKPAQ